MIYNILLGLRALTVSSCSLYI